MARWLIAKQYLGAEYFLVEAENEKEAEEKGCRIPNYEHGTNVPSATWVKAMFPVGEDNETHIVFDKFLLPKPEDNTFSVSE